MLLIAVVLPSFLIPTLINYYHLFNNTSLDRSTFSADIMPKLSDTLSRFEKRRKILKVLSDILNYLIFGFIGYVSYWFFNTFEPVHYRLYFFVLLLIPALLLLKLPFFNLKQFTRKYKKEVMQRFLAITHESLRYEPKGMVPVKDLKRSGLYGFDTHIGNNSLTKLTGEDLIEGLVDGVHIKISDIEAFKGESKEVGLIFSGNFMVADFEDITFEGETFITPDFSESGLVNDILHEVASKKTFKVDGEKVKFNFPDFERIYDVYTTNEQEAKKLLTRKLTDKMLQLDNKLHDKVLVALTIKGKSLFIGVLFNFLKMEPRLRYSVTMPHILERNYLYINLMLSIVEEVKKQMLKG